eukprot:1697154-Amphidinium_carterae.4
MHDQKNLKHLLSTHMEGGSTSYIYELLYQLTAGQDAKQQERVQQRTTHVDIRYLHVQQLHHEGALQLRQVGTDDNPADLKTKYLETADRKKNALLMGLHDEIGSINMVTNHNPRPKGYTAESATSTTARPRSEPTAFSTQAAQGSR